MTTEKQRDANRRNALASTGPRTPEGKSKASINALRHGALSISGSLLPGEDPEEMRQLGDGVREQLNPQSVLECEMAERVISILWRMRRIKRAESGVLLSYLNELEACRSRDAARSSSRLVSPLDEMFKLQEPTIVVDDQATYESAIKAGEAAEVRQREPDPTLGLAYRADAAGANALASLHRYETALARALSHALTQLEWVRTL